MRVSAIGVALVSSLLLLPQTVIAQTGSGAEASVPRVMQLNGTFRPANGQPPAPVEIVTFTIYADETGGTPLWQETQNVTVASGGDYTVVLGTTNPAGLPVDVFASGQAHWLGVQVNRQGESEQPRIRIMSVPYALRASDADTLGGRPASAYLLAEPSGAATTTSSGKKTVGTQNTNAFSTSSATTSFIPVAVDNAGGLGNSSMFQSGSGFIGLGTTSPLDAFHVAFTESNGAMTGLAVQNKSGAPAAYSGMLFYDQNGALGQFQGFNNFTHEYRINNIASSPSINFMTGSMSRFLVAPSGAIGIGTLNPAALLEVSNAVPGGPANVWTTSYTNAIGPYYLARRSRGTFAAPTAVQSGDGLSGLYGMGYGATKFGPPFIGGITIQAAQNFTDTQQGTAITFSTTSIDSVTPATRMTLDASGNLGIGTTAPKASLEVSRTGTNAVVTSTVYKNGCCSAFIAQSARGTADAPTAVQVGDLLGTFGTSGYGTTSFNDIFTVVAGFAAENFSDTARGTALLLGTTPLGTQHVNLLMGLLPSGNVGIGTPVDANGILTAADRLQVFGDIRVGTSGTNGCLNNFGGGGIVGTCASDRRFKKNISPFGAVLDQLTALQPVHFDWRTTEFPERHFGDSRAYGLIAQDVEGVLPELVVTNEDGYKAVDYSKLPLLAIQAVKELKLRNEQLSEEASALGARVDALERTVRELLAAIAAK